MIKPLLEFKLRKASYNHAVIVNGKAIIDDWVNKETYEYLIKD